MDERMRAFAWILGSGCGGGALGAVFGALAGALYWRSGRSSGTRLAQGIAETFTRLAGREMSRPAHGALVGAVDGCLFLGVVGTILGVVAVYGGAPDEVLRPALLLALFLIGAATFFGVLAYTLTHAGVGALLPVAVGGVLGAALGWGLAGAGGLLVGAVLGIVLGNVIGLLWSHRYEPKFTEPTFEQPPVNPHAPDDGIQRTSEFLKTPD
jgi:hypothetical protein